MVSHPERGKLNYEVLAPPEMILIPGGLVYLGSTDEGIDWIIDEFHHHARSWYEDEIPQRRIEVPAYFIDTFPVTNAQFNEFVESTGYVTLAELQGSGCIYTDKGWKEIDGAYWKHPTGEGSTILDRLDHPAVHMSYRDAQAYAQWVGKRLLVKETGQAKRRSIRLRLPRGK